MGTMRKTRLLSWEIHRKAEKTKKEPTIEYLIEHLKRFGNTILRENPSKYEKELKSVGIKIKYRLEKGTKVCPTEYKMPDYYLIWRV